MVIPIAEFVSTITMALAAPVRTKPKGPVKPDSYIVVLKSGEDMEHHIEGITRISARSPGSKFSINHRYKNRPTIVGLNGYSAHATGASLSRIFGCPEVEYVEADGIVSIYDGLHDANGGRSTEFNDVSAEIRNDPGEPGGPGSERPVEIGVMSTGVIQSHSAFMNEQGTGTRVIEGFAVNGGNPWVDTNGYGTKVAGRAAGKFYGPAPEATIVPIKGLHIIVPAGDHHEDTSGVSPASAFRSIAVGGIDCRNQIAAFSNYGSAVQLFASAINAPVPTINHAWGFMSGTVMSAAWVAGVAGNWLRHQQTLVTPRELRETLTRYATRDIRDPTGKMKWRVLAW
ncbi:peptidase S8/S53 domain-containing protein [Cantharellus anzutake]|uniref:peptidase S8/S53 domain-containing protein n=1 Tax=Cantharellus anzutake TaxID=1750568 RepID=UPI00190778DD|nr:peptidase S8/S53 domain-containing protein [Cantharellus anzutake]KAF8324406.1 peptidase S8/S53 domain-containing protein [Cantharellus anzutake]